MPRTPDSDRSSDARRGQPGEQFDDDAALRWDDIDDPSYVDPGQSDAVGDDAVFDANGSEGAPDAVGGAAASGEHPRGALVATRLVTAVGALIFAAYTLAWVVGVGTLPLSGPTLLLEVLYQFAEFLAIIASGLWFGTTLVLTRGRPGARAGWFAAGALVLAPWPFVFGVIG